MQTIAQSGSVHNSKDPTALAAAMKYAARGWPVVPFAERNGRKFPLTEHGFKDASCDASTIKGWFCQRPDALAAIATGEPSGVIALDVDVRADGNGLNTLEEMDCNGWHPVT